MIVFGRGLLNAFDWDGYRLLRVSWRRDWSALGWASTTGGEAPPASYATPSGGPMESRAGPCGFFGAVAAPGICRARWGQAGGPLSALPYAIAGCCAGQRLSPRPAGQWFFQGATEEDWTSQTHGAWAALCSPTRKSTCGRPSSVAVAGVPTVNLGLVRPFFLAQSAR